MDASEGLLLVPISALQHFAFCPRQCALIHLEDAWKDNRLTAEGTILHESVDERGRRTEARGDTLVLRGLALGSERLGLVGRADVVEFHRNDRKNSTRAATDARHWRPFPVEFKRGREKFTDVDRIQLCAQAMCLEEMVGTEVPSGALFYGSVRRRIDVVFDGQLRERTEDTTVAVREMFRKATTPSEKYGKKCLNCSLLEICLPRVTTRAKSARDYLTAAVRSSSEPT